MGDKILILGGSAVHTYLVETARSMGLHTVVTDYLPPERAPAKQAADEYWMLNVKDIDGIVERCRREGINAVTGPCIDPVQRPLQQICEKLGIPCYGTEEQFFKMTNKRAFKALCRENGVDVIPDYTLEDCRAGRAEYPVYVKPIDSRGSRGQSVCFSLDDVERAVRVAAEESSDGDYLIEKYFRTGHFVSTKYWVHNGTPYLSRIHDTHRLSLNGTWNQEGVISVASSCHTRMYRESIDEKVKKMLCALGLKNGPAGMQGFVDGDTVRFFDASLRPGGSQDGKLLAMASGINVLQYAIELALGKESSARDEELANLFDDRKYRFSGKRIVCLRYPVRPGKIASVEGVEELRSHKAVVDLRQNLFPGDVVSGTGDVRQVAYYVGALVDDSPQSILEMMELTYHTLRYRSDDGEIMGIIPPDLEELAYMYK